MATVSAMVLLLNFIKVIMPVAVSSTTNMKAYRGNYKFLGKLAFRSHDCLVELFRLLLLRHFHALPKNYIHCVCLGTIKFPRMCPS